ncbi:MAG TPA: hypothetical protein VNO43_06170, partial [Candidatus Eisenbacteria bacterium]|nr:hypothetical protein [Candidatus Eisenbacteria bacterium]
MNAIEMKAVAESLTIEVEGVTRRHLFAGVAVGVLIGGGICSFAGFAAGVLLGIPILCATTWLGWRMARRKTVGLRLQAQVSNSLAERMASERKSAKDKRPHGRYPEE